VELLATLDDELPAALVAITVKEYPVPPDNPEIVIVPDPDCEIEPVIPDGEDVAVYVVIPEPPLLAGAVNETVAEL
jgi:hypothetical protein